MSTTVIWFRRDLRLHDHTALSKALESLTDEDQVVGLFYIQPGLNQTFTPRHDYYYETLMKHVENCEEVGFPIHFITGSLEEAFNQVVNQLPDVDQVYFNVDEAGAGAKRDQKVVDFFEEKSIPIFPCVDHTIHGANEVKKPDEQHYKVFSSYYKQWLKQDKPRLQHVDLNKLKHHALDIRDQFKRGQNAYDKLMEQKTGKWQYAGEKHGLKRLEDFAESKVDDYQKKRDFPALSATSMLSPYLRTGAVSARTVYHWIEDEKGDRSQTQGMETFVQELAWRDFYNMIYKQYPKSKDEELIEKYRGMDWGDDQQLLEAWKEGRTGFPLIDAAIKQLHQIGWMHNRLRMAVASFLTKDLLIDWREGERYFEECLIDYEAASNIGGWQWASSTGTDAAPYFRIFNPTRQSERFDPEGTFIKKYLPELKDVPKKYIHSPETMPDEIQKEAGCVIGKDYPKPIVDHKLQRKKALELYKERG
ncbi:cryptochrome/photolyase family protein [Alkalicoccobacillus porphyridii]|uniref:Deoxyribodipyrimidine photo-lyase n=1 Tax=Alkalicoccobacillus porphyridii TaxID=2597270 RepID=A0A553ZVJ5_9BACI|nr:deoxyribodipyrimidine photo-lyase [Alkalicoccobacillus porphyridii]TSB45452.1 deoxyribodipyrimidine photo-lyase [Alkalicoccobacillus porphyridii]